MTDSIEERVSQLMGREDYASALALIEQVSIEARSASLNWSHGWALYKLGRFEQAAAPLRRAVLQAPTSASNHWALGVVLDERGELAEAALHVATSLSLKDFTMARLTLALIRMKQGQLAEAERIHLEGLQRKPDDRERVEAYADFLSDCGREEEAQKQYVRATELSKS